MTLCDLQVNQLGKILGIIGLEAKTATRLRELGLFEGGTIRCVKSTPFGGPKIFQAGDSIFSLELSLAGAVEIIRA